MSTYTFGTVVTAAFEPTRQRVIDALAEEGFGVLSEIDVAKTLETKLGVEMADYRILGACNAPLANQAIAAEPAIGALLPCNVVVRTVDEGTRVDFMDPIVLLDIVGNDKVSGLAAEVRERLQRVMSSLG